MNINYFKSDTFSFALSMLQLIYLNDPFKMEDARAQEFKECPNPYKGFIETPSTKLIEKL